METVSSYAMQMAIDMLKERCSRLNDRINILEEENVVLRLKCSKYEGEDSSVVDSSYPDDLIKELRLEKEQLLLRLKTVVAENHNLWTKLSHLAQINSNMGDAVCNANELTLRSKPQHRNLNICDDFGDNTRTDVPTNNSDLDLEEISLKMSSILVTDKSHLDTFHSEADTLSSSALISQSFAFLYDESIPNETEVIDNLNKLNRDQKNARKNLLKQKEDLQIALVKIQRLYDLVNRKPNKCDQSTITSDDLIQIKEDCSDFPHSENVAVDENIYEMMCPMCGLIYDGLEFDDFQSHVESHFLHSEAHRDIV